MAEQQKVLERTYVIPLRREFLKVSRYRRSKKAIAGIKTFLEKHMHSLDVRVGKTVNDFVWRHGMLNPPSRVKVNVVRDEKGVVRAELFGAKIAVPKEPAKTIKAGNKSALEGKVEEKPEEKSEKLIKNNDKNNDSIAKTPVEINS